MIELVFAAAVMLIIMSSSSAVMSVTERQAEESSRQAQALAIAEEGIQASISIADRSWTDLELGEHGLSIGSSPAMWIFQGTSDTNAGYTRTIEVSESDSDTKKVVVIVTWHPRPDRTATVEQELLLTDWTFI